jgi:Outer membrane protein beta-barrel domain
VVLYALPPRGSVRLPLKSSELEITLTTSTIEPCKDRIMRKLLLVTLLGAVAASFSSTSHADDTGLYLRGNVGQADLNDSNTFLRDDSDTSYGLNFGWRFLPWLSVEAGYNRLGDYAFRCADICPAVVVPPLEIDSVELGMAARVPFGDSGWFGQARLGMHRWDAGFGGSENDPYYGVGVGYQFNERFNMSLNFDRYEIDPLDIDRIGLGFEVAF